MKSRKVELRRSAIVHIVFHKISTAWINPTPDIIERCGKEPEVTSLE